MGPFDGLSSNGKDEKQVEAFLNGSSTETESFKVG